MKPCGFVKKFLFLLLAIVYIAVTLLWCGIYVNSFVYSVSLLQASGNSIALIGGDTWLMKVRCALPILLTALSLAAVCLWVVSLCQKRESRRLRVLFCVLAGLVLLGFLVTPPQAFMVSLYILVRKVAVLRCLTIVYPVVTATAIGVNLFLLLKRSAKT